MAMNPIPPMNPTAGEELLPGGAALRVTETNKHEYAPLSLKPFT